MTIAFIKQYLYVQLTTSVLKSLIDNNTLLLSIHNYLNNIYILFSQDSRTTHEIVESLHCHLKVTDKSIKQSRIKKKLFKNKKS